MFTVRDLKIAPTMCAFVGAQFIARMIFRVYVTRLNPTLV